jgi:hypothetical protein
MEASLTYATTPLALASLVIIVGVGVLKILVAGKDNALNRLVTHYGFAVVITFGLLGNAAYLYGVYQSSETIVLGNVVDKNGRYLPNVLIDTGGHARGMTSDTGEFVLAIPASRVKDRYEITAVRPGYEKAVKTVKNASRMFVRFELEPKQIKVSDILDLSHREIIVGHYMGLPVAYPGISIENPSADPLIIDNFTLTLTSPSGTIRQLIQVNSASTMNGPVSPPLPQVEVEPGRRFSWVLGFAQYDNQVQQLSARAMRALQASQRFRDSGPQVGQQLLPPQLDDAIGAAFMSNWFWEPGTTIMKLGCNSNGETYELVRTLTLSMEQVEAMRNISDYYSAGYGLIFGSELTPVGSAQPGQKVSTEDCGSNT